MKGDIIRYRKGYKYQLDREYIILTPILGFTFDNKYLALTPEGKLTIKDGYAWDGASGPTVDSRSTMRGSLVHDAFYQLMRGKIISTTYRRKVDELFREMIIEDGMWQIRALLWADAVMTFAAPSADPKNDKKIYEAP